MKPCRRAAPKKALVATTIALATFLALSAPASADPPYTFGMGGPGASGTLVIHSSTMVPNMEIELDAEPCPVGSGMGISMQVGPAVLGMAQTLAVGSSSWTGLLYGTVGATLYGIEARVADPNVLIGANNSGTITVNSPPPHTITQNLWLVFDIYEINDAPACENADFLCTLVLAFDSVNSSPLVGDYTGTIYPTTPTTITDLDGTGVAATYGPCDSSIADPFQDAPVTATDLEMAY